MKNWEKTILVSGGLGFIGSNFLCYFVKKYPNYLIINIDNETYAANKDYIKEIANSANYKYIKGNICDLALINKIFSEYKINNIIHFAAESHVDNSIKDPAVFIQTNIIGTFNLLEAAKNFWFDKPLHVKHEYKLSRFHHISTDEVYGTLGDVGFFTETTPYQPNSPYSASKASSDMLVRAYHHTYGLDTVITNCSNNYGPKQHQEKLIPTIIRKALANEPIPIYGQGLNVRDWLYVLDHCKALDLVFHQGKNSETYNIGGNNEIKNIDIAKIICAILDEVKPLEKKKYADLITFVKDRPGHDLRYAIDATKIKKELGWKPEETFKTGIKKTINWYLKKDL